jgi:hypothetical protein
MSDDLKTKDESQADVQHEHDIKTKDESQVGVKHDHILVDPELMNDAFDGENHEHEQSVWQAAKSHPWACLWAFTMCFTIVSDFPALAFPVPGSRI